jgi:endo-1,4-beta-xylanase
MFKQRAITRRKVLSLGLSTMIGVGMAASVKKLEMSLKARAAAKGLIYGATSRYKILSSNAEFTSRFIEECAILVPENDLKWDALRPSPDRFDFTKSDWLAQFARQNGLLLRGTPLLWFQALPDWFRETVNRKNAEHFLTNHIETVVRHYAGQMHSWDVVNEGIHLPDGQPNGLRKTPWLNLLGEDYIDLAFRVAAEADPQAILVYNDYDIDYDTREQENKRKSVLKLLERLKAKKTPVHALGLQAHLFAAETRFNANKLRNFLDDVTSLGLKILVTEMDVADRGLPYDYSIRDRRVADVYEEYLSVVLDEPATIAILTWGLSDRYTWLSKYQPRSDKAPVRPLPLDRDFKPKLAWHSIVRAFDSSKLVR